MIPRFSMVIQWSEEDRAFLVTFPEFGPRCMTHGDTYEEAARNGREVLELLVETYQSEGTPLPRPQTASGAGTAA
jgi:predicted RNase H-like HicB family nuclease